MISFWVTSGAGAAAASKGGRPGWREERAQLKKAAALTRKLPIGLNHVAAASGGV